MASKEQKLPAQRMEHATTKLQDAMSALKLAVEELHIVDAEMIRTKQQKHGRPGGWHAPTRWIGPSVQVLLDLLAELVSNLERERYVERELLK